VIENSFWIVSVLLMVALFMMALGYTYAQKGQTHGFPGKMRFTMFGVMSFVFIGILITSYAAFVFLMEGLAWSYPFTVGYREFDLANGFWSVLVGVAAGVFLGIFGLLKKQELYGR